MNKFTAEKHLYSSSLTKRSSRTAKDKANRPDSINKSFIFENSGFGFKNKSFIFENKSFIYRMQEARKNFVTAGRTIEKRKKPRSSAQSAFIRVPCIQKKRGHAPW